MPDFTYAGDEGRSYPYHPRNGAELPVPGETYELDDDPGDGRWKPATKAAAKRAHAKPEDPPAEAPEGDENTEES